jgi:hypothetical protein
MRLVGVGMLLAAAGCLSVASSGHSSSTSGGPLGPSCGLNAHYSGDVCVLDACTAVSPIWPCVLADGGLGTCAAGTCLSTRDDPHNCGAPGLVCPSGAICVEEQCWLPDDGGWAALQGDQCSNCPSGTECYGAICIRSSCGPTDDDLSCLVAPSPDPTTSPGFCCHGNCIFQNDGNDCGACGTTCPAGMACGSMGCVPTAPCVGDAGPVSCRLGDGREGACCGEVCADPQWDLENCGFCQLSCPAGSQCDAGKCSGPACARVSCPGDTACIDRGDVEIDAGVFSTVFGTCVPVACPASASGGTCLVDAGNYDYFGTCCDGQCVLFGDRSNCGGCGIVCGPSEICSGGGAIQCVEAPACAPGQPPCIVDGALGTCCGAECVNTASDPENCFICGYGCPANAGCELFDCDGGGDTGCGPSNPCREGEVCIEGQCTKPTCDGTTDTCSSPDGGLALGSCCGSKCTDVFTDPENCEYCGRICPSGSACQEGACSFSDGGLAECPTSPCPGGTTCFERACIKLGDCASARPGVFYGCWIGSQLSPSGAGLCCDGQCVDPSQDPNNCGICGVKCASGICSGEYHSALPFQIGGILEAQSCLPEGTSDDCRMSCGLDAFCVDGACFPMTATLTEWWCLAADGTVGLSCGNGVCAHPRNDPQNCGVCGNACPPGVTCVDGACQGSVCGIGHWGNFCGDAGERTCCPGADCTDTLSDSLNCGRCGLQCPAGSRCSKGFCG